MNVSALPPFCNVKCPACGEQTRVKVKFGPYTLVRRHAIGGMSMVFVANDATLHREVAVKILSEEFSADERRITAFEEEARITASFSHPHVVRVLTTGKAFGRFYIAMEFVPGGHFEHQIRERGKIPEEEMLPLAIEVAQGLKAAHSAGLIHRDVKPGNILLDAEGHAKIVDFGLALVTQGGKAQATEIWATPYYVPPETIEGSTEDLRSDIYAFGATVYHALAGRPSCGEETMVTDVLRAAKRKIVPLGVAEPSLSAETCRIVDKAMAFNPSDRFSSYDELIAQLEIALQRLTSGIEYSETSGGAVRRRAKKQQRDKLVFFAIGLGLLAAVSGGVYFATREGPPAQAIAKPDPARTASLIDASDPASATRIGTQYREARAAVEAGEFGKASTLFVTLTKNPAVQEPTRTWAGVEAVAAAFLAEKPTEAGDIARETAAHARAAASIDGGLIERLEQLRGLAAIPPQDLPAATSAAQVMSWMLAGLKNWEQGMLVAAASYFSAVANAKLPADDHWVEVYQNLAKNYLSDHHLLSGSAFQELPGDVQGCETAIAELDVLLITLKTRGRARFNVRAWQLDLKRHATLLAAAAAAAPAPPQETPSTTDLDVVMTQIKMLADECRFADLISYLKSLPEDPKGATRAALVSVSESAAIFLTDLKADLLPAGITMDFALKSGEPVKKVSVNADGDLVITNSEGVVRAAKWSEFPPAAVIDLHRRLVRSPKSEFERLRRHECAISFGWLMGDRQRALAAAALVSQESAAFKKRWDAIASGLPR